ncbi:hypothetical protein Pmar_PMAR008871 [Perkinsus marinus ATCC 50983]|uniref:Uncharacterized protein n=1 Tax=Perkinsus marinus (strain ATCC 50983 / TXsc) TaxID=423536 RepID=C5KN04_PERM5|nr:hypothetical protein Pmar_PMAR008871 [Perkinsus marinus ATCC 50983]EER14139.1 hypothetical protein Pmar_PMAR008871 [Perkinsus marinus ATCC 50983]|eukprot:XP_002782344.1 hypothetical protein Pmar_PMAR008871 [Perkinsus marinus ATCC 50983]
MPLRKLIKSFQAKNLKLHDAMKLLNATQREASLMQGSPAEVEVLRHDFIQYLGSRFKADEKYPDDLVRIRFKVLKDKFHQLGWDDDDESFVVDYTRVMGAAKDEIDGG